VQIAAAAMQRRPDDGALTRVAGRFALQETEMTAEARASRLSPLPLTVVFAAAVFAAALWSLSVSPRHGGVYHVWLANALLTAMLLRTPVRQWAGWCVLAGITTAAAHALRGYGFATGLALILPNAAEALTAAALMRAYQPQGVAFDRIGMPLVLLLAGGLAGPAVIALVGAAVLGWIAAQPYAATAQIWFTASAIGALALLPLALAASLEEWRRLTAAPRAAAELAGWLLGAGLMTWLTRDSATPFVYISLVPLLAALRLPLFQSLLVNFGDILLLAWLIGSGRLPLHPARIDEAPLLAYLPLASAIVPAFLLAAVRNVREQHDEARRRAEQKLAESEARWKFALEGAEAGVWDYDIASQRGYVSERWKTMLGYPADADLEIGRALRELVHPEDLPRMFEAYKAHEQGSTPVYVCEYRMRCRDGSYKWLQVRGKVVARDGNGRPLRLIGTHTDISDKKAAEDERQRLVERVTLATKAGGIGIWEWNPETREGVWDQRVREMYGLVGLPEGPLPLSIWMERLHPDDRSRMSAGLSAAIDGWVPVNSTYRVLLPGGEVRHIRALGTVVRDDHGRPLRMIGCNWDVTDSVQAQAALREANERLRRSNEEVAAANREVRNFAYIVSHDLRAPLVNIRGFAGELRYSLGEIRRQLVQPQEVDAAGIRQPVVALLDGDIAESLSFIDSSVDRMNSLIQAILRLSRVGQYELSAECVDLEGLTRHLLDSLRHDLAQAQGEVALGAMPSVIADRNALEQILGNLLANAVKYRMPQRPLRIEVSAESDDAGVTLHVRDNGRGMTADDIPRAFELFRRVGLQDTAGEGMGLAYVQALVRRMDGRIWCDSQAGEGSVFHVWLPLATVAAA
jgi:PAS domain S-box-containing protein